MDSAQAETEKAGFLLTFSPMGVSLVPMLGDKPMTPEQFAALPADQRSAFQTRQQAISNAWQRSASPRHRAEVATNLRG
jgi:hypothetical protein